MSDLLPHTSVSHYRIVAKVGAGGMGEVYLAQDTKLDRKVALKILPADLAANQDRMRRFVQEAKAAAALNHPNIAHIYEIGGADGVNFIAMEFVDGLTLHAQIHREKSELKVLLKHLLQVAEGLAKAHASGIVHRDLKPDNIMITREGHAKILDFGLAKLLETKPKSAAEMGEAATAMMPVQLSTPGAVMGTVGYMSPEQAQAKPVDQRSDIFSFGCILYEAATARRPFAGDSVIDTLHKIIHDPAPAITDFNPSASPELLRVIRKCLVKEPDKRYQTIRDTANDLEELIEEMKGVSDIERSVAPPTSPTTGAPDSTADDRRAESTVSVRRPAASSAEYIVSGFKQHKIVAVIALLVLVGGAVGLGLYLRAPPAQVAIESIAVMPFVNESGNPDVEYLSDGMTETLISSLSNLPNLNVKPRSSVFHYKGKEMNPLTIAKELNVQAILNGRVVQRGDQLTLSLELVDSQKDVVLWAEQYNRKQGDLVSLQSEIARDVSSKLKSRLSGTEVAKVEKNYTANPEAYRFYLQGRFYWNKRSAENITKALELFKAAVDKDPNYALAYVGLADCYVLMPEYIGTSFSEVLSRAKAYAMRALEIDASLAEAHASLGVINWLSFNYSEAEKEYKRSIELNPNYATAHHWYARFLLRVKRLDEALAEIKRANELDPLSVVINRDIARVYRERRELDSALEQIRKTIELEPNFPSSYNELAWVYLKQGRNAEALAAAEKAVELSKRAHGFLITLGEIYIKLGKLAEAHAIVKELEEKYAKREASAGFIAWLYAGLGEKEKVFPWLEKALKDNNGNLDRLEEAPEFEFLRGDPRFKDLLRRMRLPE